MSPQVPNYTILKIKLPGTKFVRYLYVRKHRGTAGKDGDDSTLFVANLPAGCTPEVIYIHMNNISGEPLTISFARQVLRDTFEKFGEIVDVELGGLTTAGAKHVAHVVFRDTDSVKKVERIGSRATLDLVTTQATGLDKWLEDYHEENNMDPKQLLASADSNMTQHDAAMQALEDARLMAAQEVDEDGFTTVVSTKKKKAGKVDVAELDPKHRGKGRTKKKKKDLVKDFYSFQSRETKRDRLMKLREQFEGDKLRIEKMKNDRKFKPY